VFGQRYDAFGSPQGPEFRVNTFTYHNQAFPQVASAADGRFVVVWTDVSQDGSGRGVFAQRYDASGTPQGGEFRVNSYVNHNQYTPKVASDPAGNFVVVWPSQGQDGSYYGIFAQRFNASGARQGGEFRVNAYTTGRQYGGSVAMDAAGNFVVVWESPQDGSYGGVFGRRFNAAGVPQGDEFQVNSYTSGYQYVAAVASEANGSFVVVWASASQDGDNFGIFGQRFETGGVPEGSEFPVNTFTIGQQFWPAVSSAGGGLVVAWQSDNQDGSGPGVFGQRFSASDLIFSDGFESGNLSRWSSASTDGFDLVPSQLAALAGTEWGVLASVDDTHGLYVQDDLPSAEDRYRARFYFDPNGIDPGEGSGRFRLRLLIAFDGLNRRLVTLVLRRREGAYSVHARTRLTDGTRAETPFFPISDAPHFVEFDWQRSGPGMSDGYLALSIDGVVVANLLGLANDASAVEFVRMGALTVKTGAGGILYLDEFHARRQGAIGP
jgi:hypothetical protein